MKPSFAGLGFLMLAATPLAAIPLALSGTAAQAQDESTATPPVHAKGTPMLAERPKHA